jgi:hypothetical protein
LIFSLGEVMATTGFEERPRTLPETLPGTAFLKNPFA